ncbi:pyrimidine reductase family protein [Homoserinimonas hongtaonis]|uniref:Pyrimidine reductase family protein n=1 Tax=Homoserinimonas hongtaonis TaxID=2079791 RepID=A0A2U1T368_9MICO|nr:pyrimidine reductase family protein [Salinibacterium hongtaonis]AWB88434.1 pyrimidine reductase family protein [Salinibacterium hongtaonis]PWB98203.1 pyrimidine reductase family protein [Salinibacterium hongtaonis]
MSESGSGSIRMLRPYASLDDDGLAAVYAVHDRAVPWLRVNFITSIDGAATHDGLSGGLGTSADRRVFDVLRWLADVIVVGAGTVRTEGYGAISLGDDAVRWRREAGLPDQPVFAIVSNTLRLDPASDIFTKAPRRPLILTSAAAPADLRSALAEVADVIDCGEKAVDTRMLRTLLAERGLPQMHSEGGPHLFGAMIADGSVDELCITVSPRLEGGMARRIVDGGAVAPRGMHLAHTLAADDGTLLLRYVRADS